MGEALIGSCVAGDYRRVRKQDFRAEAQPVGTVVSGQAVAGAEKVAFRIYDRDKADRRGAQPRGKGGDSRQGEIAGDSVRASRSADGSGSRCGSAVARMGAIGGLAGMDRVAAVPSPAGIPGEGQTADTRRRSCPTP